MRRLIRLILPFALLPAALVAQDTAPSSQAVSRDDFAHRCRVTPSYRESHYPGDAGVVKYNNLIEPAGKAVSAPGQLLYITGRVFDERCVPLANAQVDIWQTDTKGAYHFPDRAQFINPYPIFAGSGEAVTDNNGQFSFYTVFPGPTPKHAPQVNFRVTSPYTQALYTTMFFAGDQRNKTDEGFIHQPDTLKSLVLGNIEPYIGPDNKQDLHAHFDITVPGYDAFKRF